MTQMHLLEGIVFQCWECSTEFPCVLKMVRETIEYPDICPYNKYRTANWQVFMKMDKGTIKRINLEPKKGEKNGDATHD